MPAPRLRELQAGFWTALHDGDVAPALAAVLVPSPTLAPAARLGIYQSMYVGRLADVLREDHPKLAAALGDAFWPFARRYLAAHPSEHPSVRHVGRHVPAHLHTDAAATRRPWLPDLARLERARLDAFDAPDAAPLRAADLARVAPEDWPELRFRVAPGLCRITSAWRIDAAWDAPTRRPARAPARLRVWRRQFVVFHAAMDAVEADALDALAGGASFAGVCEAVAGHVPADGAAAEAGALLARWIADELLVVPTSPA